jgi:cytochrome c2
MCKSETEWRGTIERMIKKNPEWISPAEAEQILKEILTLRADRVHAICQERRDYEDARFLFIDRCTFCHNINRVLYQNKTPEEWKETVERMCTEAMGYITDKDAERVARFLSERAEMLREDAGAKLFLEKCMNCHPGEQILLETHDRKEWRRISRSCSEVASKTFKSSWLHPYEVELIVDMLAKTQGPPAERR